MRCSSAVLAFALLAAAAAPLGAQNAPATRPLSTRSAVYFWTREEKLRGFPAFDSIFAAHPVRRGAAVHPLPAGRRLAVSRDTVNAFMRANEVAGLLVLVDGRVRLERYALGHTATRRWTSFSVGKSLTSTLAGAAVKDGAIRSLDDNVAAYLTALTGSVYDGVTVRQLLTMTSGVAWNETYADPRSDIVQLYNGVGASIPSPLGVAKALRREARAGTTWRYKTVETHLLANLVVAATRKPLAQYASEKIWAPYGMEADASWVVDDAGVEQGGCCLQATLRDYGRVGQFVLDGARVNGAAIVPEGWMRTATSKQADIGAPGHGYGYQWWTSDDGTFDAQGIFGQSIHVDPTRRLVVVMLSAWPTAVGDALEARAGRFVATVTAAVDVERRAR